jgi:hypothetical protein
MADAQQNDSECQWSSLAPEEGEAVDAVQGALQEQVGC